MGHRWITVRVFWMTAIATALTFAMVLGTLIWTAYLSNRQAARDSIIMVRGGLETVASHLREKTLVSAPETTSMFLIHDIDNTETKDAIAEVPIPPALEQQIKQAIDNNAIAPKSEFYTLIDGKLHIIMIARAEPMSLLAQELDAETIAGIGAMFLLDDLRVSDLPIAREARLPIHTARGETLGYLVWSPAQPGATTIELTMLPIAAALSIFLVIATAIIRVAKGGARALDAREAETTQIARKDGLTDLPNRTAFGEQLNDVMNNSQHEVSVVVMDINNFKRVNDIAGTAVGDELIAILALKLQEAAPSNAFLARVGGDEFRLIFSGFAACDERDQFFEKLAVVQEKPIRVNDRPFDITHAVGFATAFPSDISAAELLRRADLAMYEAKNLGQRAPLLYHSDIENDNEQKQKIEDALRAALVTGEEFEVRYQPVISAKTGKMVLAEALIRWTSAELGRMSPDRFIPIAESSGLIVQLGKSLMSQVCSDLRSWSDMHVAVNLSPAQLRDPTFMQDTAAIIKNHGVRPERIEFELTEGIFVADPNLAGEKLAQLRAMGHRIALDDFGTGFSSIGYLSKMKFDKLKIDKSFIDDLGTKPNAEDLLKSLALLAKSLGLTIVAEGVERETQYESLYALGYDYIQGYYCGRAMPFFDLFSIFTGQLSQVEIDSSSLQKAS